MSSLETELWTSCLVRELLDAKFSTVKPFYLVEDVNEYPSLETVLEGRDPETDERIQIQIERGILVDELPDKFRELPRDSLMAILRKSRRYSHLPSFVRKDNGDGSAFYESIVISYPDNDKKIAHFDVTRKRMRVEDLTIDLPQELNKFKQNKEYRGVRGFITRIVGYARRIASPDNKPVSYIENPDITDWKGDLLPDLLQEKLKKVAGASRINIGIEYELDIKKVYSRLSALTAILETFKQPFPAIMVNGAITATMINDTGAAMSVYNAENTEETGRLYMYNIDPNQRINVDETRYTTYALLLSSFVYELRTAGARNIKLIEETTDRTPGKLYSLPTPTITQKE